MSNMTLTYNPNIAKINLHAKYQGRNSNGSADRRMNGRYQVHYLSAARCYAVDKNESIIALVFPIRCDIA